MGSPDKQSLSSTLQPTAVVLKAFKQASRRRAVADIFRSMSRCDVERFCQGGVVFMVLLMAAVSKRHDSPWMAIASLVGAVSVVLVGAVFYKKHCTLAGVEADVREFADVFGLQYRFRRYLVFRAALEQHQLDLDALRKARRTLEKYKEQLAVGSPLKNAGMSVLIALITGVVVALATNQRMMETGNVVLILVLLVIFAYFYAMVSLVLLNTAERQLELETFLVWYEEELGFMALRKEEEDQPCFPD